MINQSQTSYRLSKFLEQVHVTLLEDSLLKILIFGNPQMTNLRTDEIVFFSDLTKIGTDENKAIYSIFWYSSFS